MTLLKNKKVLIVGAGPTRIGQSAECDEGAVEAASALMDAGCRVISVDANPNALITEIGIVHQAYLEPLTRKTMEHIVKAEKPDAILPVFGGRTGLDLAVQWDRHAKKTGVEPNLWGTPAQSLCALLERDALTSALSNIQMATPTIYATKDLESAIEKAQEIGFPVILRCDDSNLIPDGVLVYNQEELRGRVAPMAKEDDISLSVEASLRGWHQAEVEILRDVEGTTVTVGIVEYMDSADIHPGDAIGITPPQTLSQEVQKRMEAQAAAVAAHFNIIGNATLRFAFQSTHSQLLILAVHPRYTRTSALISRAAGIAIARIAALLAAGLTWSQLPTPNGQPLPLKTGIVAVKWPRWDFERFETPTDFLGPQMQAIGQALAMGRSFQEAFQKAWLAADTKSSGLGDDGELTEMPTDRLLSALTTPNSRRSLMIYEALRRSVSANILAEKTQIDIWFIEQLQSLVKLEKKLSAFSNTTPPDDILRQAKVSGFSDRYLSHLFVKAISEITDRYQGQYIEADHRAVSSGAKVEGPAVFTTFNLTDAPESTEKGTILLIGSGPEQIGQGSEWDHGLFQAAKAVKESGFRPVVVNSNLASLSTGPSFPAKCYCEAITADMVRAVAELEKPAGIIFQFAGPRSSELASQLIQAGLPIMGVSREQLQLLKSKPTLWNRIRELGIPQPAAALVHSPETALAKSAELDFPLLAEPAVAGAGERTEMILSVDIFKKYLEFQPVDQDHPLFIQRFLEYAIEAQAETLSDAKSVHVAPVMEHIELAGVHAGDSAWVMPPYSLAPRHIETISEYARKVTLEIGAKGAFNLRFAIYRDTVYLLDVSYGMSRNMALVAKTSHLPMALLATRLIMGDPLMLSENNKPRPASVGVRAAVFPFNVFPQVDPLLGTRMRSTGEVLATAGSFGMAYFKALEAAGTPLPMQGTVLITVTDEDKPSLLEPARIFQELGFHIMATRGTHDALAENGIQSEVVRKLGFGRPNLVDEMKSGRVQMVINTPTGDQSQKDGSYIRKAAIRYRIANITTPASAVAAAKGIAARRQGATGVPPSKQM